MPRPTRKVSAIDYVSEAAHKTRNLTPAQNYALMISLPMLVGEDSPTVEWYIAQHWPGDVTDISAVKEGFLQWYRGGMQ